MQTNDKLYNSLAGADEEVVKAANGIIKNYLLPGNVSGMSEDERKSMIGSVAEDGTVTYHIEKGLTSPNFQKYQIHKYSDIF